MTLIETINFSELSGAKLTTVTEDAIKEFRQIVDELITSAKTRTIDNTLVPYNQALILLTNCLHLCSLVENVHTQAELRTTAEQLSQQLMAILTEYSLNPALYQAIKAVAVPPADRTTLWLQENLLKDFQRAGIDQDEVARAQIRALNDQLTEIKQRFDRNIRDDKRMIKIKSELLAGLPADYVRNHPADADGLVTITTDYPDYEPFMLYARDTESRRSLYLAYTNRAFPTNEPVLKELLQTYWQLATKLNFNSSAALVLDNKMVQLPEAVARFIADLKPSAEAQAQAEFSKLLELKQNDISSATDIYQYEKAYYSELYKKRIADFDSQDIRPYLPYQHVRDELLKLAAETFQIEITENLTASHWHADVQCYDILEQGTLIGRFFLDMHPREGKYNHAAQFSLQTGVINEQIPIVALICNFSGGKELQPADSLMRHSEVETFFHEFGHLLHSIFGGQQRWLEQSGTATEWDFVEVPSQFWQELVWDKKILQRISSHHQTAEHLPDALIDKLLAVKDFAKGLATIRQLGFAQLSLTLYQKPPDTFDPLVIHRKIEKEFSLFLIDPEDHWLVSFGHLAHYTAAYYTYLWSLAIVHDFIAGDTLTNLEALRRYRQTILNPGGSKPAKELIKDFLGRDYTMDAFKQWLVK